MPKTKLGESLKPKYISVKDFAEYYAIKLSTAYEVINSIEFKPAILKIGKHISVDQEKAHELILKIWN